MKKCNIVCGGVIEDIAGTAARVDQTAYTICADSGYAYIEQLGLRADVVLGDFDSFERGQVQAEHVQVFPVRKDYTDSEIAVMHALELGYREITLLGALGGRIDHALGNLHLLAFAHRKGAQAMILDGKTKVWYSKGNVRIEGKAGDLLSVIPLVADGVYTTHGLEYALEHQKLPLTGISNVFIDDFAEIQSENAEFFVVHIIQ